MIIFNTLIKPIPINQKLKRGRGSRLYLNSEYRDTWNLIKEEFIKQYNGELIKFGVSVTIKHSYNRYDIDSLSKSVLDILQGIAYVNDNQVVEYHVYKEISDLGYLIVEVDENIKGNRKTTTKKK